MDSVDKPHGAPLSKRLLGFFLEALKLLGIAVVSLVIFVIAFFISIKTGIRMPERWWGLLVWTLALLWIIFWKGQFDLRNGKFWATLFGLLAVHFAAFIPILRLYPDWRMAWFPIVYLVEGTAMFAILSAVARKSHHRKRQFE
jgi:hypothetical protein